jgi:hypothetical protein
MYQQLALPGGSQLLCLFLRKPLEPIDEIFPRDFERRMLITPPEGGVSFFRADLTTYREVVNTVRRQAKATRGLASIPYSAMKSVAMDIHGDSLSAQHVCLHCESCDGAEENCEPSKPPRYCTLVAPEHAFAAPSLEARRFLADSATIIFPAKYSRDTLLEILSEKVTGTVEDINAMYMQLLKFHDEKPTPA